MWIVKGSGPETVNGIDGKSHNPFVKPSLVKKLAELGATDAGP